MWRACLASAKLDRTSDGKCFNADHNSFGATFASRGCGFYHIRHDRQAQDCVIEAHVPDALDALTLVATCGRQALDRELAVCLEN
jgi:hypothetical protein